MQIKKTHIDVLLERMATDDNNAFRLFYDYYYFQVYRFSSYFVRSSCLIEEVVSDVFCIIWQNRKKLSQIKQFDKYLYAITRNKALYYLRREGKVVLTGLEQASNMLSNDINPEYLAIDEELTVSFKKAVEELPERCRLIFLMSREEKLKYKEIAEILCISEKTVNAQMVLAIKKLTKRLEKIVFFLF